MEHWLSTHFTLNWTNVLWAVFLFVVTFVVSLAAVTFILIKLPADYFQELNDHPPALGAGHPVLRWTALIAKNVLGLVLIAVGLLMLLGPGQGVLTILIGLMLLNFPGKRQLERKLVSRPGVLAVINRMRARFNKPPLIVDHLPPTPVEDEPRAKDAATGQDRDQGRTSQ